MNYASDVWIVVPAYNEGQVICQVLEELSQLPYTIVIVDDGSIDNTVELASQFPIVVLKHIYNLGQGAALQTGISFALRFKETRFIVTFDSDGQHNTKDIPQLLDPLKKGTYDVALGSRFLKQGNIINISQRKRILLKLAIVFTRLTTGLQLTDTHNGLRAFTAEAARKISITQNRMAHASEILVQIAALKLRYCEVPVTISYTSHSIVKGQSIFESINILLDIIIGKIR